MNLDGVIGWADIAIARSVAWSRHALLGLRPSHPHQHLLDRGLGGGELSGVAGAQHHIGVGSVLPDRRTDSCRSRPRGLALAISPSWVPMSPSRASARMVSDSMRTPVLSFGATSSSIACMIEGTPAMTMTLSIQMPGAPDTLLSDEIGALGDARHAQARVVHLDAGRGEPLLHDRERARIDVDRHAERLGDAVGGDVVVRRPDAAGGEHVGVATAQRIERIDDRRLLVADDAHLHAGRCRAP